MTASFLALATPASSIADPYADAAAVVTCPQGPTGWFVPDGAEGRSVLTPLTVSGGSQNEAPIAYGGTQVNVDCTYWTKQGGRLTVTVRYALPIDFNPYADFYIGCNTNTMGIGGPTGPKPWDTKDRLYRVLSPSSWSYATFYDAYAQLQGNEVGVFESIAQQMLKSAQPIAHNCTLTLAPQAPQTLWAFGFSTTVKNGGITTTGGATGTFMTRPNNANGIGQLSNLEAKDFILQMTQGSKSVGTVTIQVTDPLSFKYSYGAAIRALIKVTSSSFAPCHVGATGTLTVSTNYHFVTVQVCHRNLLEGTGQTTEHITAE